jgi:hypothetical protein
MEDLPMGKHFDERELDLLADTEEVEIETAPASGREPHRTTIWVVVVGSEVYARSVNGVQGRWYQNVTANPMGAIYADEQRIPMHVEAVSDQEVRDRVSDAYLCKYAQYPQDVAWMIGPDVVSTTLRFGPS